jgi:hypothetical protein
MLIASRKSKNMVLPTAYFVVRASCCSIAWKRNGQEASAFGKDETKRVILLYNHTCGN